MFDKYIRSEYVARYLFNNAPLLLRIACNKEGEVVKLLKPRNYNEWFVVIIPTEKSRDMGIIPSILCVRSEEEANADFNRVIEELGTTEEN